MPLLRPLAALALLFAAAACEERSAPSAPAPAIAPSPTVTPVVRTSSASLFVQVREGPRPVFRQGDLHVYVSPSAAHLDLGLPGVAFGGPKGPRYGLLGGYFAPRILAPDSKVAYRAEIDATARGLRIRFFEGDHARLDVEVKNGPDRPQAILRGEGLVAMPADRARIFGRRGDQPAFSRDLTAGEEPKVDPRAADRVEVDSRKHGGFRFETSCPRVFLVSPVPRGSTSVFVLASGARAPPTDPLYAPEASGEVSPEADCAGAVTSTLTVPRPR